VDSQRDRVSFGQIITQIAYAFLALMFFLIMLALYRLLGMSEYETGSKVIYLAFTALCFFAFIASVRGAYAYIKDNRTDEVVEITGELIRFSPEDGSFILRDSSGKKHYLSFKKRMRPEDMEFFRNIRNNGTSCCLTVYVRKRTGMICSYEICDQQYEVK